MAKREYLSYNLTRLCMLCALVIGVVLSLVQIGIDGVRESARIDARMQDSITIVEKSAAEAVYNIDDAQAERIISGLASIDGVVEAKLALTGGVLAQSRMQPPASRWRVLTDLLFAPERVYTRPLHSPHDAELIGQLRVVLDTAVAGRDFVSRSLVVVGSGLVRAIVLAAVLMAIFYLMLARPFIYLAASIAKVDPEAPERVRLPVPLRHQHDEMGRWVRAVNGLLESIRNNLAARAQAEDQASFLRQFDPLTGLPNRALFHDRVSQSLLRATRDPHSVAVIFFDLRAFQRLNDEHGFAIGDLVLTELAHRLRAALDESGQLARIAGDRFAAMIESRGDDADILARAQAIRDTLQQPLPLAGIELHLDVRLGVSVFPRDAQHADELIRNAETALSIAKRPAHSGIQFYELAAGEEIRSRHRLRGEIETAIASDQFLLHYQPQFATSDGRLLGVEALLRWPTARDEGASTEELIRIAEESGQIVPLGDWVLRRACQDAASWACATPLRLAINISALQLEDRGLVSRIEQSLTSSGLRPEQLEIEITETAMMADVEGVAGRLVEIRNQGVQVAIDDFGTGHSSLRYLKSLPINSLKIDRAFVRDVCRNAGDAQIVSAILGLGRSLNLRTVAEGVEEEEQMAFLRQAGCDEVQGFWLARPMSAGAMAAFARDSREATRRIVATRLSAES